MKAVLLDGFGGIEVLKVGEAEQSQPVSRLNIDNYVSSEFRHSPQN